jgi:O-antigen/teichoic acid export membrane protein
MKEKIKNILTSGFFKKLTGDFMFSVIGLVIYYVAIQFLIYPQIKAQLGSEGYGNVLFYISFISIMASTLGTAANYSRMILSSDKRDTNGDYNRIMLISALLCVPVVTVLAIIYKLTLILAIGFLIAMVATLYRYYSDCEFKLSIKYSGLFFYYLIAAAGNILGVFIFKKTNNWTFPLFLGEALAVVFVMLRGNIYRKPFLQKSEHYSDAQKSFWTLVAANIIPALILNSDRLLLKMIHGGSAAEIYYTASLIGKSISFLTTPLNGVLIGYLARWSGKFTKKIWFMSAGTLFAVGVLATFACFVGSYIYVGFIYPDDLDTIKQYFFIANAGQIFYFISNSLMVIVLRFAEEKYQTIINAIYAVLFIAVVPVLSYFFEINGFAAGLLIVNFAKFFIVVLIGLHKIKQSGSKIEIKE